MLEQVDVLCWQVADGEVKVTVVTSKTILVTLYCIVDDAASLERKTNYLC